MFRGVGGEKLAASFGSKQKVFLGMATRGGEYSLVGTKVRDMPRQLVAFASESESECCVCVCWGGVPMFRANYVLGGSPLDKGVSCLK